MESQEVVTRTVRHLMVHLNETQADIGQVLGLKGPSVSLRMTGRRQWSLSDVDKLAQHWGCQSWDVLQGPMVCLQRVIERRGGAVGVLL